MLQARNRRSINAHPPLSLEQLDSRLTPSGLGVSDGLVETEWMADPSALQNRMVAVDSETLSRLKTNIGVGLDGVVQLRMVAEISGIQIDWNGSGVGQEWLAGLRR